MQIKWNNLFALVLAVFATVVCLRHLPEIGQFFAALPPEDIRGDPDQRSYSLLALAMFLASVVGIVKILSDRKGDKK